MPKNVKKQRIWSHRAVIKSFQDIKTSLCENIADVCEVMVFAINSNCGQTGTERDVKLGCCIIMNRFEGVHNERRPANTDRVNKEFLIRGNPIPFELIPTEKFVTQFYKNGHKPVVMKTTSKYPKTLTSLKNQTPKLKYLL